MMGSHGTAPMIPTAIAVGYPVPPLRGYAFVHRADVTPSADNTPSRTSSRGSGETR